MENKVKNFLKDESGQAFFEYIFLLSLVITGAVAIVRGVLGAMDVAILKFGGKLENALKTGRAPPNVWKN